jgi:hypothetical protein
MTLILLTGAGFTRNWGGWLANEAFEYILGRHEISKELRSRLWQDKVLQRGFEDTLGELQRQKQKGDQSAAEMVRQFMAALVAMFDEMNRGLSGADFEWQKDTSMQVRPFLARFHYIFTLNQDLLLEAHYLSNGIDLSPQRKFDGVQRPGMKPMLGVGPVARWTPDYAKLTSERRPTIEHRQQPYIKLHGSSDWVGVSKEPLLVLGGGKSVEIGQDPLLTWYQKEFSEALHRQGAKLMVIGYSFSDDHINEIIGRAADQGGLTLFIVGPEGVDVLDKWKSYHHLVGTPSQPLRDQFNPHIRGASRRPLSATFGYDRVEHGKLMAFLNG